MTNVYKRACQSSAVNQNLRRDESGVDISRCVDCGRWQTSACRGWKWNMTGIPMECPLQRANEND